MNGDAPFVHVFDNIYSIDLQYEPGCYKLCGDAHCCHFSRYKPEGRRPHQELPLLPGEWEYLSAKDYLSRYRGLRRKRFRVDLACGPIIYDALAVDAEGCPCPHLTRPVVCRLYPLIPTYDPDAGLVGIDDEFSLPEIVERHFGALRACRLTALPFHELTKLLAICRALGSEPVLMFYLGAYDVLKAHLRVGLTRHAATYAATTGDSESALVQQVVIRAQTELLRGTLIDWTHVTRDLDDLGRRFQARYGARFDLSAAVSKTG